MTTLLGWGDNGDVVLLVLIVAICLLLLLAALLASHALWLRHRNNGHAARLDALEASWTPLLLASIAGEQRFERLWAEVERGDELAFVRFVARFVRRVAGDDRLVLKSAVEPYLERLAARAGRGSVEDRAVTIQILGEVGLPAFGDTVVAALDDRSPLVAMVAARSLAFGGRAEYTEDILAHLPRLSSWSRGYLAAMLASIGPDAAPALRKVLADRTEEAWKRTVVADALRWLNDLEAVPLALDVLRETHDRDLTAQAFRLVARLGDESASGVVRPHLESEDFMIRAGAIRTLGTIGGGEEDRRRLVDAMNDPSPWVSTQAARALARLGERSTLEVVAEAGGMRSLVARYVIEEEMDWQWT
jgi:HEAT repeat protein